MPEKLGYLRKANAKEYNSDKEKPLWLSGNHEKLRKISFQCHSSHRAQSSMTKEQAQKQRNSMTVLQSSAATISYVAQKLSNKILSKSNNILTRFVVRLFLCLRFLS